MPARVTQTKREQRQRAKPSKELYSLTRPSPGKRAPQHQAPYKMAHTTLRLGPSHKVARLPNEHNKTQERKPQQHLTASCSHQDESRTEAAARTRPAEQVSRPSEPQSSGRRTSTSHRNRFGPSPRRVSEEQPARQRHQQRQHKFVRHTGEPQRSARQNGPLRQEDRSTAAQESQGSGQRSSSTSYAFMKTEAGSSSEPEVGATAHRAGTTECRQEEIAGLEESNDAVANDRTPNPGLQATGAEVNERPPPKW